MQRQLGLCLALSLVALAACSQPTPSERIAKAQRWLGGGKSDAALIEFRKALAVLDPASAEYFEARMGEIEALIPSDPTQVSAQCILLSNEFPQSFGERQFHYISGQMISARQYMDAIDVVDAGLKRFGTDSEGLRSMAERITLEAANDKRVQDKRLATLGYLN